MKKILSVMLAILMMASLTACQTVEDFRDGLAHITGTETEPPSAFTPTLTPEAETDESDNVPANTEQPHEEQAGQRQPRSNTDHTYPRPCHGTRYYSRKALSIKM